MREDGGARDAIWNPRILQITVDGINPANHRLDGAKTHVNNGDFNYLSLNWLAGFLNHHQQYVSQLLKLGQFG